MRSPIVVKGRLKSASGSREGTLTSRSLRKCLLLKSEQIDLLLRCFISVRDKIGICSRIEYDYIRNW